ncbi:hypothetical protein PRZ48_012761 [Zasmidium cellare]|uniref:Serine hydrolase domain-containing protein n=1 Tax=Zasmidium cellare TaxID=395010 RepID=A0ABR0E690_ZASCE|nr:hypothetical protein PRZ48_012761 [Zasmidium cellare]
MMRVLCLHGAGSNNNFFQNQTATLRAHLPDFSFEFVQGTLPHQGGSWSSHYGNRNDDVEQELFTYFTLFDPEFMLETERELIDLVTSASPPFDGVLAYSIGCSLAFQASMRYEAEREPNSRGSLFKFAIFCNAVAPSKAIDIVDSCCFGTAAEVESRIKDEALTLTELALGMRLIAAPSAVEEVNRLRQWAKLQMKDWQGVHTDRGFDVVKIGVMGVMPFDQKNERLHIPTLHVRDPMEHRLFGERMQILCDPKEAREFFHDHGHEFPRGYNISKTLADLVRETAARA